MAYIKSKDIQIFPSAFRGQQEGVGTTYNPGSRLTTEYNLTSLASRMSSVHKSYVIEYNKSAPSKDILFSLNGYLFAIKMNGGDINYFDEFAGSNEIWAKIKLVPISDNLDTDNTIETKPVLRPLSEDSLVLLDVDDEFVGLELTSTKPDDSQFKVLKLFEKQNDNWFVPKSSYFRIYSEEVESKLTDGLSINDEFNVVRLTADKINNVRITPASDIATLTIANNKTLTSHVDFTVGASSTNTGKVTIQSAGSSATTITGPNGGTVVLLSGEMVEKDTAQELTNKTLISPTLKTPDIGVATAESVNKVKITKPESSATLTIHDGKTLTVKDSVTLAGTGTATFNKNLTVNKNNMILVADDADRTLTISGENKTIAGAGTILTLGGNLTTTGAFNTTFVQKGDFTFNLPTSAGTLARIEDIQNLDVEGTDSFGAGKTIKSWSQVDGKISITSQPISIASSQINDKTDTYTSTGTLVTTGKALKNALSTITASGTMTSGKTIASWSQVDGKLSITTQNISISKTQISDFAHEHNYAGSDTAGGPANTVKTTPTSTSERLYLTGVLTHATSELKRSISVYMTGGTLNAAIFNSTSDERLKENIKDYEYKHSILDLKVKEFDYKDTKEHTIGFIAQDLQKYFPELVTEKEDGYLSIAESKLVYLLLEEVKQLKAEIEKLKE